MIIARLEGGLGNQMFQYAAARRLAEKHSCPLKLDLSWFNTQQLRQYKLSCFNIYENFATPQELEAIIGNYSITEWLSLKISRKLGFKQSVADLNTYREVSSGITFNNTHTGWWIARIKHKFGFYRSDLDLHKRGKYIREKHHHFDPDILEASNYIYLDGFWQSPKYFSDVESIVRQEFTLRSHQSSLCAQIVEQITNTFSVSLHVRRGDMANDPQANQLHGTCNLNYYKRAVEHIANHVREPHFFVFSDDPTWVKENLKLNFPSTLVSCHNSLVDNEEMYLMSRCQHHITANSTFSWWGAWLNPSPNKLVVAPQKFFADFACDHDVKDLYPTTWTVL